jgi:putative transposase
LTIRKSFRVRLYPTKQQEQRLLQTLGACRFVWNHFLEQRKKAYLETGKTMNYHATALALTKLKKTEEVKWLDAVQAHPLQQSLRDLEAAYKRFFTKQAQYPRFKTKKEATIP